MKESKLKLHLLDGQKSKNVYLNKMARLGRNISSFLLLMGK